VSTPSISSQPLLEPGSSSGVGGFQATNDAKVYAGNYDRFQEIGNALMAGQFGDAWRHVNFEASPDVNALNNARLFPAPNPAAARFDQLLTSPVGAGAYSVANMFGASQHTQDVLLGTGAFAENLLGGMAGFGGDRAQRPGLSLARVRSGPAGDRPNGRLDTFSKDAPYVIRYDPSVPGRPDPQYSVDSLKFKDPIGHNAQGFPRDAGEFWRNWIEQNPDSISTSNKYLIDNYGKLKVSPRVDKTWIDAFPEHGDYMGDVLIHHHVDFGQYTIPVPGRTHVGSGGPWHM
ncbi:hypothetical protein, partial [Ralstonia pseudosolanacearum]|uniref:hypothetical protein n=1 Tax=Ralstonia pseudosolanacearum TaxID=1310165 RepID=UPI003CEB4F10